MALALAVVIVLLVVGSVVFHFVSPWYFTDIASNWGLIDFTVNVTFWVAGIVFVAVNIFTVYCIIKFKHRPGQRAHYEPEKHKLEMTLTVLTALGVAAMLAPGLIVWGDFVESPDNAKEVEAVGKQWHWSYRLPGDDGQFGNVDVRQMSVTNPLGIDPSDPAGADDVVVTDPVLHLAVNEPVHVWLRSTDVLHNFTVPQFRVKMDLVPGMITYQWFNPEKEGTYEVLCEELCGIAHFAMRSKVVVESQDDYDAWLDAQPTFAETQAAPVGNATRGQALYGVCSACHGQRGEGNVALNAPKLAGQDGWYIERQISHFQRGFRGGEGDTYGAQMAPMARTLATPQSIADVVAYIATLDDQPSEHTISGDAADGRRYWQTCGLCHGAAGEGNWDTNAPRLAGMNDWYLKRQLENFRAQIRGGHPEDIYGDQMFMLASILKDENAVDNVVTYINSLD